MKIVLPLVTIFAVFFTLYNIFFVSPVDIGSVVLYVMLSLSFMISSIGIWKNIRELALLALVIVYTSVFVLLLVLKPVTVWTIAMAAGLVIIAVLNIGSILNSWKKVNSKLSDKT